MKPIIQLIALLTVSLMALSSAAQNETGTSLENHYFFKDWKVTSPIGEYQAEARELTKAQFLKLQQEAGNPMQWRSSANLLNLARTSSEEFYNDYQVRALQVMFDTFELREEMSPARELFWSNILRELRWQYNPEFSALMYYLNAIDFWNAKSIKNENVDLGYRQRFYNDFNQVILKHYRNIKTDEDTARFKLLVDLVYAGQPGAVMLHLLIGASDALQSMSSQDFKTAQEIVADIKRGPHGKNASGSNRVAQFESLFHLYKLKGRYVVGADLTTEAQRLLKTSGLEESQKAFLVKIASAIRSVAAFETFKLMISIPAIVPKTIVSGDRRPEIIEAAFGALNHVALSEGREVSNLMKKMILSAAKRNVSILETHHLAEYITSAGLYPRYGRQTFVLTAEILLADQGLSLTDMYNQFLHIESVFDTKERGQIVHWNQLDSLAKKQILEKVHKLLKRGGVKLESLPFELKARAAQLIPSNYEEASRLNKKLGCSSLLAK